MFLIATFAEDFDLRKRRMDKKDEAAKGVMGHQLVVVVRLLELLQEKASAESSVPVSRMLPNLGRPWVYLLGVGGFGWWFWWWWWWWWCICVILIHLPLSLSAETQAVFAGFSCMHGPVREESLGPFSQFSKLRWHFSATKKLSFFFISIFERVSVSWLFILCLMKWGCVSETLGWAKLL